MPIYIPPLANLRKLVFWLLYIGAGALALSAFAADHIAGVFLWRIGVACLLVDIVLLLLFPDIRIRISDTDSPPDEHEDPPAASTP